MNQENAQVDQTMSKTTAGFAISAAITVLFNTVLACTKDAWPALLKLMNRIAWHNWITQGIADLVLFILLGLLFSAMKTSPEKSQSRLASFLTVAVIVSGLGLFVWYAIF